MRRVLLALVSGLLATAVMASAATAATQPNADCPLGARGAGGSTISGWELWTLADVAETIDDPAAAAATFDQYNRNNDDYICVLTQVLPNDASGSDIWYFGRDNTVPSR